MPETAEKADAAMAAESHDPEAIPLVAVIDPATAVPRSDQGQQNAENATATAKKRQLSGLTKEELQAFADDPFWRRLRLATLVLFCVVWLGLFAAVIVIVAASPKCPPRPARQFWQRPVYRLQLATFAPADDADPSAVGSVAGLTRRLSHLRETLGLSNLILGGRLLPVGASSGCTSDFAALRPALGTLDSLKALTKAGRKKGFNLMMELDLSQADPAWDTREDAFVRGDGDGAGGSQKLQSRDSSGPAWRGGRLHLPRGACDSLNVTSPATLARLETALTFWLDAGVSGFLLTNVAFLSPSASTLDGPTDSWFARDPSPALYSNASVQFVNWARRLLNRESGRLGRDLALFVDPGNTGFPQPADRLAAYLDPSEGAHAVVSVGLGRPLSDKAPSAAGSPSARRLVESVLAATAGRGSVIFATAWPSLRRPSDPLMTALSLTLPGVPCLYYGQELGMAHVPGVRFQGNASLPSYLPDDDSTDASETPMQWTAGAANAGWLANASVPLAWVDLAPRAGDIAAHNLRLLGASGHPQSALQFARQLLGLASAVESLQWGGIEFLATPSDRVVAFRRRAVRYSAVLVVANSGAAPATVDLTAGDDGEGATGSLRLIHSPGADGRQIDAYRLGESYSLDGVFVPGNTTLIFQAN